MMQYPNQNSLLEPTAKEPLRLWLRLLKTNRIIEAELRERLRLKFSTTLPRFDVMSALYRNQRGLKMSELSRMLLVSNGNVTGIVDRLSKDGLMLRENVPGDRRAYRVRLTQKGIDEFLKQASTHEIWVGEILGGQDAETCKKISTLLAKTLTIGEEVKEDD
jgi:DNA-binding MarR family transcriptional regulator